MNPTSQNGSREAITGDGERLVKLALCVKEHTGITFGEIRRELPREYGERSGNDASVRRRFERDKDSLRAYGLFLEADAAGGYAIDEARSYAAPVDLTEGQRSLLRLLCNALLNDPSYPLKNELRMVLAKIGDDIELPDLLPATSGSEARKSAGRPVPGLQKVRKAIAARKRLRFEYRDASGHETTRDVEPFGCFLLHENCYIVAFDPSVRENRMFRLDRMGRLGVNGRNPGTPDFPERPFDAAAWRRLPFQFGDREHIAQVRFDAANAWRAARLSLGQGALSAPGADGSVVWSVPVRDDHSLARWCIENGPGVVPLGPDSARAAYRVGIEAALESLRALDTVTESSDAAKEGGAR